MGEELRIRSAELADIDTVVRYNQGLASETEDTNLDEATLRELAARQRTPHTECRKPAAAGPPREGDEMALSAPEPTSLEKIEGNGPLQVTFHTSAGVLKGDPLNADEAFIQATAAPIGKTIAWNNPNTGNYGTVTPVREGTSNTGEYCREFRQTIGGTKGYAVACRQGDGAWRMR